MLSVTLRESRLGYNLDLTIQRACDATINHEMFEIECEGYCLVAF